MTSGLMEDIANGPDPDPPDIPSDDTWANATFEKDKPLTKEPEQKPRRRRGRPPKIDPETGEPANQTKRTYTPRTQSLKDDLLEPYMSIASDLAMFAPTASGVLIVRAEKTVDGVVDLCAGHPRALAALKKVSKGSRAFDLIETALMLLLAVAVDIGKIPVDSPLLDTISHVEIERDDKGKFKRDDQGKMLKTRLSLRDIRNKMVPEGEEVMSGGPPPMPESFSPATGMGGLRPPVPMNNLWVEHS